MTYLHNYCTYIYIYTYCPPNKHGPSKPPIHFMSLAKRSICVLPGKTCSTTSTWTTTSH